MTVTSSGEKKGGLCALVAGEEVVLVGLDREKPGLGKRIEFGRKVDALGFLDGATLGGRTDRGAYNCSSDDKRSGMTEALFRIAINQGLTGSR